MFLRQYTVYVKQTVLQTVFVRGINNMNLQKLNEAQLAAVCAPLAPALVLAGAGSGKTRVLTNRILYLVTECGVDPSQILAITFTNKAANEMKRRLYEFN